jgi:(2Fe-2S) ferredoxin
MVDLEKPVRVVHGDRVLFEGVAPRTIASIAESLAARGDPSAVFAAKIMVDLGTKPKD